MTNLQDILAALTAEERSPEDRIASIEALHDFLHEEAAVFALIDAAKKEKTTKVRGALLKALLAVDITRITRRDEYLEELGAFSAFEEEPELREAALRRLGEFAPAHPKAQAVLAETLLFDFRESVQDICLTALATCPRKERSTVERLIEYGARVPPRLREKLLSVYAQLDRADFEAGILQLLNPLESESLRRRLIELLAKLPSLSPSTAASLIAYLAQEPLPELRERVVQIISNGVQMSLEFLRGILEAVRQTPEEAALLYGFWDRLFAFPEAVPELQAFFKETASRQVKLYLLRLLAESDSMPLFAAALEDANPWVRQAALERGMRQGRAHSQELCRALVSRIPTEPILSLRIAMIGALGELGRLDAATEQFIVQWLSKETSPQAQRMLAKTLPAVAVTDQNRHDLLSAYVKVLKEPFYDEALKTQISEKLRSFSYRNEPELKDCLQALMERSLNLHEVERDYKQLRTQVIETRPLLPLLRRLLYRFIGQYPQAPLDEWVRELAEASAQDAAIRAEIPYIVRLTGESWILEKAEVSDQKSALLPAILERIRKGALESDTRRLLEEAYETRTLRKSDAGKLLERILTYHDTYPLLQPLLEIMTKVHMMTPELLDRCLDSLVKFPSDSDYSSHVYDIRQYLESVGPLDPEFSARLSRVFTPEAYRYLQSSTTAVADDWNQSTDWERLWRLPFHQSKWALAELFFAQAGTQAIAEKLLTPIPDGVSAVLSFPYFILAFLDQEDEVSWDSILLSALSRLVRSTKDSKALEELHDRALCVFTKHWPDYLETLGGQPIDSDMAKTAAEVFAELCARRPDETAYDPAPLVGMDLNHLEAIWPLGTPAWDALWVRFTTYLNPRRTMFQRDAQKSKSQTPLRYIPLEEGRLLDPLMAFLVRTPLGTQPVWRERWKSMLLAVRDNSQARLTNYLKPLNETDRQRILNLMA